MRPSWMSTSIRSPGPYGGRPETNNRSRSASRSASDIPKRPAASATLVPSLRTRYGTTVRSRRRRSEARSGALRPDRAAPSGGKDRLDAIDDLGPDLGRLEDLGVGPEREHPRHQLLPRRPGHPNLDPPVASGPQRLGIPNAAYRPPRDLRRERHDGRDRGFLGGQRAAPHVVGGAEPLGRPRALAAQVERPRDPG